MAGSFEHREGNAGERPSTNTAELPALISLVSGAIASIDLALRNPLHPFTDIWVQSARDDLLRVEFSLRALNRGRAALPRSKRGQS